MKYCVKNFVTTNASSTNHGKPAELDIRRRGNRVILKHGIIDGGSTYAVTLDAETAGRVAAELISFSSKATLPEMMGAIGSLLASDAAPPTISRELRSR